MKKCRICKKPFEPFNSMIAHCSAECGYEIHKLNAAKKQKKEAKAHKKELIEFRKNDKSIAKLRAEAQKEVNAYVRLRDEKKPCICCGTFSKEVDAGHYRSRGSAKHLAFNTFNIHKQNVRCNRYLGGNYSEYRVGLINRIGLERVERLENDNAVRRFDKEYLVRIKKIFAERTRHLKRIRG